MQKIKRVAKEIVKPTKRPEGPIDYFVYKGVFGIYFATNGRTLACWIKPCKKLCDDGNEVNLPGYWKDVHSTQKVTMDGEFVQLTADEALATFDRQLLRKKMQTDANANDLHLFLRN